MNTELNLITSQMPHYLDELYNFALRMTGSGRKAESLLVQVSGEAVKFRDMYVPADTRKWLLHNAVNLYGKFYAAESDMTQEKINDNYEKLSPYIDKVQVEKAFNSLNEEDAAKLFLILPSELRMVLVLKEIVNLSYDAIAELLDIPEDTVVSRINLARKCIYMEMLEY